jgi:hypothetical protein
VVRRVIDADKSPEFFVGRRANDYLNIYEMRLEKATATKGSW